MWLLNFVEGPVCELWLLLFCVGCAVFSGVCFWAGLRGFCSTDGGDGGNNNTTTKAYWACRCHCPKGGYLTSLSPESSGRLYVYIYIYIYI